MNTEIKELVKKHFKEVVQHIAKVRQEDRTQDEKLYLVKIVERKPNDGMTYIDNILTSFNPYTQIETYKQISLRFALVSFPLGVLSFDLLNEDFEDHIKYHVYRQEQMIDRWFGKKAENSITVNKYIDLGQSLDVIITKVINGYSIEVRAYVTM